MRWRPHGRRRRPDQPDRFVRMQQDELATDPAPVGTDVDRVVAVEEPTGAAVPLNVTVRVIPTLVEPKPEPVIVTGAPTAAGLRETVEI